MIYRVHESPSTSKLKETNEIINKLGYSLRNIDNPNPLRGSRDYLIRHSISRGKDGLLFTFLIITWKFLIGNQRHGYSIITNIFGPIWVLKFFTVTYIHFRIPPFGKIFQILVIPIRVLALGKKNFYNYPHSKVAKHHYWGRIVAPLFSTNKVLVGPSFQQTMGPQDCLVTGRKGGFFGPKSLTTRFPQGLTWATNKGLKFHRVFQAGPVITLSFHPSFGASLTLEKCESLFGNSARAWSPKTRFSFARIFSNFPRESEIFPSFWANRTKPLGGFFNIGGFPFRQICEKGLPIDLFGCRDTPIRETFFPTDTVPLLLTTGVHQLSSGSHTIQPAIVLPF